MKFLPLICRILLGFAFAVLGLNGLHPFIPAPPPPPGTVMTAWINIMMACHWSQIVSVFQIIGGLLVWFGGTTPLGLVILCPITVNILLFHLLLAGGAMIGPGIFVTVLELLLIYFYRANFAGILTTKALPVVKPRAV